jgi:methylenetetrahydrofolate dehydrogenase (NADP+)/methenyltetrahydrofolate cyclohydrolase
MLTRRSEHATVTLDHEATVDTAAHTRDADIVIAAAGVAHMAQPDWVRAGAIVRAGATALSLGIPHTVGEFWGTRIHRSTASQKNSAARQAVSAR